MTEKEIAQVKKSWKIISKIDPVLVGDVFYSKLFLETPELKSLFRISRQEQSKKLIAMVEYKIDYRYSYYYLVFQIAIHYWLYPFQSANPAHDSI